MKDGKVQIVVIYPISNALTLKLFIDRGEWSNAELIFLCTSEEVARIENGEIDLSQIDVIVWCGEEEVVMTFLEMKELMIRLKQKHSHIYMVGLFYFGDIRDWLKDVGFDHISHMLVDLKDALQERFNW